MNSIVDRYRRSRAPSPSHCEPKPPKCSICGMLECVCRPRFFAGQVLTADDLNRLDHYIRAKHRLHNRQLHGWGVVNGLEVTCDVCGGGVVVGCGYALSPCGEDIVVCEPVVVDVCALIKACREEERATHCDPPRPQRPRGCEEGEDEWILAIRYSEAPTRAVKPLMSSAAADCGCAPAKKSCGCDNGAPARPKPRNAPVQCEPTVVCEGYAFEVYRKPPEPVRPTGDDNRLRLNPDSELYQRFECCSELLLERMPTMPGPLTAANVQANLTVWHQWMCRFKDYLQMYLSTKPGYNCELLARLNTILCPPLNAQDAAQQVFQASVLLAMVWLDALLACYCSALLPPCPTAHPDERVPLATIRVNSSPCRVLTICNWTRHRKFATTFPALQYWLSILPFGAQLRRMIERICCFQIMSVVPQRDSIIEPGRGFQPTGDLAGPPPAEPVAMHAIFQERASRRLNPHMDPEQLQATVSLAAHAAARGSAPLDPQKLFESALLADKDKDAEHLSALELANLPQFLALNQLLRPLALDALGSDALAPAFAAGLGEPGGAPAAEAADVAALKEEMQALRADIARQAKEIEGLKRQPPRKKGK